jgi:hypothetical protein
LLKKHKKPSTKQHKEQERKREKGDTFFNICIEEQQLKLVLRWDELYATQKILAPQMPMEQ